MADYDGDPSKQPLECKSVFKPFSDERPFNILSDSPNAAGYWTKCSNIYESGGDFDTERYSCDVCGKYYTLYYDDMK